MIMRRFAFTALLFLVIGCSFPQAGLQPNSPAATRSAFSLTTDFVEADSVQPALAWQSVTQTLYENNKRNIDAATISDITYELRIWETDTGYSGKLVYRRLGIPTTYHTVEEPLKPNGEYLWSVRAHFLLDGKPRVSEWGMAGFVMQHEPVPNPSCFRFKTP